MSGREDADAIKWRGRLLAERMASRNARDEAEQWGNKLLVLEKLLKAEAKSRNRAEKKLKLMMKRLQSINISYNNLPQLSAYGKTELVDEQRDLADNGVESSTLNQENDQDPYNHIDNSMALIAVDTTGGNRTVDPEFLDETVKEVLDALRRAKEQLLSSMERKGMSMIIKVG